MKKVLLDFSRTHLLILAGFVALALAYMNPVLDGKVLSQSDMNNVEGMSQELKQYQEETGEYSQWTNSMFSGMPAFHVGPTGAKTTVFRELARVFRLGINFGSPVANLF